ncbi:unnamed protein product [Rhizoctonia solani]|uniref:Uncharacterized protein n=1 Tax=Rhizoctonia solani TaxID=456999 RepID=A0A8H2WT83_9AGAM|nr:unnamed protein product [Rhizoctonia solani]
MGASLDLDEVSDREVLPRTPTLAGSTSSLDDSLLQSPYSTRYLGASASLPTKRSSSLDSRVALEGSCRAWWGGRTSMDSSNWRASVDSRAQEHALGGLAPHESLESLQSSSPQSDETASITPTPTPGRSRSVSGAKRSPPPATKTEELEVQPDIVPGLQCSSLGRRDDTPLTKLSRPLIPPSPEPNANLARQLQLTVRTTDFLAGEMDSNSTPSNPLIPRLSVDQFTNSESLYIHAIGLSPHLNISSTNSSMLAHCDQSSLAPPCVSMTQTQCGRSALREAGIAHGSPRALAPSYPIENVSVRSHNNNFFRRFVRRTFSKSSFAIPAMSSQSLPAHSASSGGNQKSQRSWSGTTFPFGRPETSSNSRTSSTPKRSRWALLQCFVSKPTTAAKAAGADATRRPRNQLAQGAIDHTRRHTFMNVNASSVSFFGDQLARIDPFARSDGLGAMVSPIDTDSPVPSWNEAPDTEDHNAHIVGDPVQQCLNKSWGEGVNKTGPNSLALTPDVSRRALGVQNSLILPSNLPADAQLTSPGTGPLDQHPIAKRVGQRHSAPVLNAFP